MIKRYRSPSVIKKRRKRLLVRGAIVIGAILFVLGGLSYLSRLSSFQITTIGVEGISSLSQEQIKEVFNKQIAGTYAFIFPKKNVFIYPKKNIEEELNSTYKQIEELDITFEDTHSIQVEIKERQPYALWCTDATTTADCYFLDNKGYVFNRAPNFSGTTYTKYYGHIEGEPIGTQFVEAEKLTALAGFITSLKQLHVGVIGIQIENKVDYIAHLKDGGKILFNDEEGFDLVVDNLATVIAQDGIKKEDIEKIDYINLRFDKKVFFKLKE